jgi:hypothetical protein
MPKNEIPDLLVLLPGITGSAPRKNGRLVWGYSSGQSPRHCSRVGRAWRALILHGDDPDLDDLEDGIAADELMSDVQLAPAFWRIDSYGASADCIQNRCEVTEGESFFRLFAIGGGTPGFGEKTCG